ncbi:MAG: PilZ domain-containing protein [Magnetococcales bacterium]|nr:PilZ domain-containing protein [Magnetococcales bacterium]
MTHCDNQQEPAPNTITSGSHREDERFSYITQLHFIADKDSSEITGRTADVSMSGAFMLTTHPPKGIDVGDGGVVDVTMKENGKEVQMAFHCQVARVTNDGLGLTFDEEDDEAESETVANGLDLTIV